MEQEVQCPEPSSSTINSALLLPYTCAEHIYYNCVMIWCIKINSGPQLTFGLTLCAVRALTRVYHYVSISAALSSFCSKYLVFQLLIALCLLP